MKDEKRNNLPMYLLLVTVIIVVVYVLFIKPNYYLINGGDVFLEPVMSKKLSPVKGETVFAQGDSVYICRRDGLEKLDTAGESIWNKSFYMDQPQLLANDNYLATVGINAQEAYIFNNDGLTGQVKVEYPIILAGLSETGYLVLVEENSDSHQIEIFNWNGEKAVQRKTRFDSDGYPVGVAISPDSTRMVLSYAYFGENMLQTRLSFLNFSDAGETYEDRIVGGFSFENSLSPSIRFLNDNDIVVISDNRLDFYSFNNIPSQLNTVEISDRIECYDVFGGNLTVRFGSNMEPSANSMAESIVTFNSNGEVVKQNETAAQTTAIVGSGEVGYHLATGKVEKYSSGKKIWEAQLHQDPLGLFELSDSRYLIVFRQSYDIYRIKDI